MEKTIKAKFKKGVIEPLERLMLEEGEELNVTISTLPKVKDVLKALKNTAGGWEDLIDAEELKRKIHKERLITTRPEPKL